MPKIIVGGVARAEDAIEYFMAGASFVGVTTVGHLRGPRAFRKIVEGIERWVADHGYADVSDFIGLTLRKIAARRERGLVAITQPRPPIVNPALCNACGRCETACVYAAIRVGEDKIVRVDEGRCYGCGLCRDVGAVRAIRFAYFD
jgi:heterodisulfide reductase subunit A-like polyferredoxin